MCLLTVVHRFLDYLPAETAEFVRTMQIDLPNMVTKTTEDLKAGVVYPRPIFVKALLDSNLSKEEKSPDRIYAEVLGILGAGTETTAWWVLHELVSLSDIFLPFQSHQAYGIETLLYSHLLPLLSGKSGDSLLTTTQVSQCLDLPHPSKP